MTAGRTFTFEQLDPKADRALISRGLNADLLPGQLDDLVQRTVSPDFPSIYLAAMDGSDVAGLVCFIPHRLTLSGQTLLTYQAAGVLTSSSYRGRGVFPAIVQSFEENHCDAVSMIFGFPNQNAHPIWINKLGYREIPCRKWKIPINKAMIPALIKHGPDDLQDVLYQNDRELIAIKGSLYGERLRVLSEGASYIWGVDFPKRFGPLTVNEFRVGGARFESEKDLRRLVSRINKGWIRPRFLSVTAVATAPLTRYLRFGRLSQVRHEVMTYKCFRDFRLDGKEVAIYAGVTDWF